MPTPAPRRAFGTGGGVALPPPTATRWATRCATMLRLSGLKHETLCCTCAAPNTASTTSCTDWYRSAGSLASALRMTVLNGSSMFETSGSLDTCFSRISPALAPR